MAKKKLLKIDEAKHSNSIMCRRWPRITKLRPPLDSTWWGASNRYPFYPKIMTLKFNHSYLTLTWPWPDLHQKSPLNRLRWSSNQYYWVWNEKMSMKHTSHGPIKIWFMCWPLVTCPRWPDLIPVTSISNIGTKKLTLYRLFSIKRVLHDAITHSIEHPWKVRHLTFDLTCDVISNSRSMKLVFPRQFNRAIERRLNFINLPSSSGDTRGAKNSPRVPDRVIIRRHQGAG